MTDPLYFEADRAWLMTSLGLAMIGVGLAHLVLTLGRMWRDS